MTDAPDPERSEGVLDRVDGRHYGDDVEGEDYSDLTGEAPPCDDCGKRQAVDSLAGFMLCRECMDRDADEDGDPA